MGSLPLTRKFHEELKDTYHDLPSTFLLDECAFKSHSYAQKWLLMKLRVKLRGEPLYLQCTLYLTYPSVL